MTLMRSKLSPILFVSQETHLTQEPGDKFPKHDTVDSFLVRMWHIDVSHIPEVCHPFGSMGPGAAEVKQHDIWVTWYQPSTSHYLVRGSVLIRQLCNIGSRF